MKTTAILLTLSFVFVSFLNAQNNPAKTKNSHTQKEVVVEDGFASLLANNAEIHKTKPVYFQRKPRLRSNQGNHDPFSSQSNPFANRGEIVCCVHPLIIEQYNPRKEN